MGNYLAKRKLRRLDSSAVPNFGLGNQTRWARVIDVYDGDTVTLITFFRGKPFKFKVRMLGYDCPEIKPPLDNADRQLEIEAANQARQTLITLLYDGIVRLECPGPKQEDKYGRLLGVLYDSKGRNINQLMIDYGWGLPYRGGKKTPFTKSSWNPKPAPLL
jgi:endonuclease YncB( thermonuclease family)